METYGILSVVPVVVAMVVTIITKRTWEPMLLGGIVGFIIIDGTHFFSKGMEAMFGVMTTQTLQWLFFLLLMFGALSALFEKSRSTLGFERIALKVAKNRKSSLIITWFLGILVFADDYLNALAVATAMKRITDRHGISRQFLAYMIASTGASVCSILPFASWSAYFMTLMDQTGVFKGDMFSEYMHVIPVLFFSFISLLIAPLFALGIVPLFGPMRQVEKDLAANRLPSNTADVLGKQMIKTSEEESEEKDNVSATIALTFVIPIVVLAVVSIKTGDVAVGVVIGLALTVLMVLVQRLMKPGEVFDTMLQGMGDMFPAVVLGICVFFMQASLTELGLTEYVINSTKDYLTPSLLPVLTFIGISALAFATANFWGLAAIAFPIILPLAELLGANLYLASGALIGGAVFGSQACFYGDCAIVVSMAAGIKNVEYGRTVIPLVMLSFGLSCIAFLIAGFVM